MKPVAMPSNSPAKNGTVLALIQARMGSTRFPAKVLSPILGKPMLQWQLERLAKSEEIDQLVVATSDLPADDAIFNFCRGFGAKVFRGSEASVLDRFYDASLYFLTADQRQSAILVRLTGDCPLGDPSLIDEGIREFRALSAQGCRYLGFDDRMPDGMDFEVFPWEALDDAYRHATDSFEKEHATPYMWRHPQEFGVRKFYKAAVEPGLRFSVDYEEDRDLVEAILLEERARGRTFGLVEIGKLLAENQALRAINAKIVKNEGLVKTSLSSAPFRTQLAGRETAVCGVAVPERAVVSLSEEMMIWAGRMGIQAWATAPSEVSSLQKKLEGFVPEPFRVWSTDALPADWLLARGDGAVEIAELKKRNTGGIFFTAASRGELAEKLVGFCQKRFSSEL